MLKYHTPQIYSREQASVVLDFECLIHFPSLFELPREGAKANLCVIPGPHPYLVSLG